MLVIMNCTDDASWRKWDLKTPILTANHSGTKPVYQIVEVW